jgi:hypothetical protein
MSVRHGFQTGISQVSTCIHHVFTAVVYASRSCAASCGMRDSTRTEVLGICAMSTGAQGARFSGAVARVMMARQRAASSRSALVSQRKCRCIAATIGLYSVKPRHVISMVSALQSLSTRSCEVDALVSSDRDAVRGSHIHVMRRGSRDAAMNLHDTI